MWHRHGSVRRRWLRVRAVLKEEVVMHLPGRPMPLLPAAVEKEPRRLRERLLSADDGAMAEERWGRKVVVGRVCGKTACGGEGWRQRATGRSAESGDREGAAAGKGPMAGGGGGRVQWPA